MFILFFYLISINETRCVWKKCKLNGRIFNHQIGRKLDPRETKGGDGGGPKNLTTSALEFVVTAHTPLSSLSLSLPIALSLSLSLSPHRALSLSLSLSLFALVFSSFFCRFVLLVSVRMCLSPTHIVKKF